MNDFFAKFTDDFTFDPKTQPELELARLRNLRGWNVTTPEYKKVRREFLEALVKETKAPMHTYFVLQFPDFDYDSRASPKLEFQRLREFRKWKTGSRPDKRARRLFVEAFDQEFDSDLDEFFKNFKTFDYNPRNEPKAEFERLRIHKKWKKKYGKTPAEQILKDEYQAIRDEFFEAFVGVFIYFFGLAKDYNYWGYLCDLLGVHPIPSTPEGCEKVNNPVVQ